MDYDSLAHRQLAEPHWLSLFEHPGSKPFACVTLYDKGKAVSCFRVFDRTFRTIGCELAAVGVGGVFTRKEDRCKGYASMLLRQGLPLLPRQYLCALLYCRPDLVKFYRKFGFALCKPGSGLMVLPRCDGLHLNYSSIWEVSPRDRF